MTTKLMFADHFSSQAAAYRPAYPAALFDYLAELCPARELAWDCGCGNGQAAVDLAACTSNDCGFVHWNNPLPVLAASVEHEQEIVLANNHGWPAKMFGLITGFLEQSESPEDGILRAVKEELGLLGEIVSLVGVYPFPRMNQVIIAWQVRATGTIRLGQELRACKRSGKQKLRAWDFGTGLAVRDWLQRQEIASP